MRSKNSGIRTKTLVVLSTFALAVLALSSVALANPKDIPAGWRKVYSFNIIGHPEGQEYTGGCGEGNRLFVSRDAHHAHVLVTNDDSWNVTDCNATADNWGELTTSEASKYAVFLRILGPEGANLRICADTYEDHLLGEHLCLLDVVDLTREHGQPKFSLAPSAIFDAGLEDIVWSVDTNSSFKIVQVRVYEIPL